jgi:hypothetical protein
MPICTYVFGSSVLSTFFNTNFPSLAILVVSLLLVPLLRLVAVALESLM